MKRRHESSAVAGGFEAAPDETDAVAAIAPSAVALTDGDIAPFVRSLYSLVDDAATEGIISWTGADETSFTVWDNGAMERSIIPRYFRHRNFTRCRRPAAPPLPSLLAAPPSCRP